MTILPRTLPLTLPLPLTLSKPAIPEQLYDLAIVLRERLELREYFRLGFSFHRHQRGRRAAPFARSPRSPVDFQDGRDGQDAVGARPPDADGGAVGKDAFVEEYFRHGRK